MVLAADRAAAVVLLHQQGAGLDRKADLQVEVDRISQCGCHGPEVRTGCDASRGDLSGGRTEATNRTKAGRGKGRVVGRAPDRTKKSQHAQLRRLDPQGLPDQRLGRTMYIPGGCMLAAQGADGMSNQPTTERGQRDARLNIRTSAHQQQLIRSAAAALDKSVTDFVLDSATANAERVLADRRWFVLSKEAWADLEALLDAPVGPTPKLAALLNEPTVFDSQ